MFDSHKEVNLWHKQEADKERTVPDHPYQQDKAGLYSDPARRKVGVVLGMVFFWVGRSSVENAPILHDSEKETHPIRAIASLEWIT
jgi:hypothetical protein